MDNLINNHDTHRAGLMLNVEDLLGDLDKGYLRDLEATIDTYEDYEIVNSETYNDYKIVCGKLEILNLAGYLDDEELNAMRDTAAEMRYKKLEALIDEENKS